MDQSERSKNTIHWLGMCWAPTLMGVVLLVLTKQVDGTFLKDTLLSLDEFPLP